MKSIPMTSHLWHCTLLGIPTLQSKDHTHILERKTAALLAYLAQEGPTPRANLIGLLWPDTREAAARNNLVHLLRKLKALTNAELVTGAEVLTLIGDLQTDVAVAREHFTRAQYPEFNRTTGIFLHGLSFDDCPDLETWILAEREQWNHWRTQALLSEANALEQAGEHLEATAKIREMLTLDPLSEEGHRRLMRLQYLLGNRHHALDTFKKLQTLLKNELGVEPLPETFELARWIEQATLPIPSNPRQKAGLPLTVLRPPALVGREKEWEQMETAWEQGQIIFLRGEPGVGKSRLARDFAASRGAHLVMEARPGDSQTPYASAARNIRTILDHRPDLPLEPWMVQELSRILPELSGPTPPPPMNGQEDLLRFHEAVRLVTLSGCQDLACCVVDDWQYYDEASSLQGAYLISQSFPMQETGFPRFIECYRKGELSSEAEALMIETLVNTGMAVLIDVEPLPEEQTVRLLEDLGVEVHPGLKSRLSQYAGGNPLFLLETVRHLMESGQLQQDRELTVPQKVSQIIERRLQRLSAPALQAARAAAVLHTEFDLDLVAAVLNAPLMDFIVTWEELDSAQIVKEGRFSHDLIFESVLRSTPKAIQQLLHRSAAKVLTARGAPTFRVAHHHQQGGDLKQAAPLYLQAAQQAHKNFGVREASRYFMLAAEAFRESNQPEAAFDALCSRVVALGQMNERAPREEALPSLFEYAGTPLQRAQAHFQVAEFHSTYHEGPETAEAARKGLEALGGGPLITVEEQILRANLHASLAVALWIQQQIPESTKAMWQAVQTLEPLGESPSLASNLSNLGVMLDHSDRHTEAIQYHQRAIELHRKFADLPQLATTMHNLAVSYSEQGRMQDSLTVVLKAGEIEQQADTEHRGVSLGHAATGQAYFELGLYGMALEHYHKAIDKALEGTWHLGVFEGLKGELFLNIGEFALAHKSLKYAAQFPGIPGQYRSRALINLGTLQHLQGEDPTSHFDQAAELLKDTPRMISRARLWLAQADTVSPEEALELSHQVLQVALEKDLGGTEISARTRLAQAHLKLSQLQEAREQIEKAAGMLDPFEPARLTRGEVLLTLWQVREACHDTRALEALERLEAWLDRVLRNLPPEHHPAFKAHNPVARRFFEVQNSLL